MHRWHAIRRTTRNICRPFLTYFHLLAGQPATPPAPDRPGPATRVTPATPEDVDAAFWSLVERIR